VLTGAYNLKVAISFATVSKGAPLHVLVPEEGATHILSLFLLLVYRLFSHVRLFTVDCSSHVRLLSHFHKTTIFPDQTLIAVASIAIWHKNKVATAMAIGLWGANAAFFIYCELPLPYYAGYWALTPTWSGHSCRACKYFESTPMIFNHAFTLSLSQLRATWIPVQQICAQTNLPSSKLNLIAIPVTDISLLLIMLVGLFRLRGDGMGAVGLARVLWRQVISVLACRDSFNPLISFHYAKGILWLLLALAAEVPPMVSLTNFSLVSFPLKSNLYLRYSLFWT